MRVVRLSENDAVVGEVLEATQPTPSPLASSRATASTFSRSARQAATTHPGPRAYPLRPCRPFRRPRVRPRASRPRSFRREDKLVPRVRCGRSPTRRNVDGEALCRDGGGAARCGPGKAYSGERAVEEVRRQVLRVQDPHEAVPRCSGVRGQYWDPFRDVLLMFASYGKDEDAFGTSFIIPSFHIISISFVSVPRPSFLCDTLY
ncbi:hypothetical protein C8R45DRAFT_555839 [Mycena sanguinolenta]|nr:hypothetical protein C8R45DRAFT_555839 [Mycena sanguinolenta]